MFKGLRTWLGSLIRPRRQNKLPRRTLVCETLEDRTVPATTLPQNFTETPFASGLSSPTSMAFAPDGRLFVTEKGGSVRIVQQNGSLLATPFLTVQVNTASERGLLGLDFDPNFAANGFVYVYYTTNEATPVNRVSRFTANPNSPNVALAGSEDVLLDDIASTNGNHNGGALHFGADGTLYVGVGEAGVANNAQTLSNLSGKILRINPDGTPAAGNPFINTPGARPEIFALGLRNPFTFAVQPGTGRIFANDVGGTRFEEINDILRGGNYGWPTVEGVANNPNFINPLHTYANPPNSGTAITGGVFQESSAFPQSFRGYYFADFLQNFINRLNPATNQVQGFATGASSPVDLDVAPDGSLMYLSIGSGTVFRIRFTGDLGGPAPGGPLVIVGSRFGQLPRVRVLDGATGEVRLRFLAFSRRLRSGVRVAVGEVTGDGILDILAVPRLGFGVPARVRIFDIRTGRLVRSLPIPHRGPAQGFRVAAANIVGDGRLEILVRRVGQRRVLVLDAVTGARLGSLPDFDFPGLAVTTP